MAVKEIKAPVAEVLVEDLQAVAAALNAAHMSSMAEDLVAQYRKLSNRQQYSPITRILERSLTLVETYIAGTLEEEGEEEDGEGGS